MCDLYFIVHIFNMQFQLFSLQYSICVVLCCHTAVVLELQFCNITYDCISTVQYIIACHNTLYYIILYGILLCCGIVCCIIVCYIISHYVMVCCIVFYYNVMQQIIVYHNSIYDTCQSKHTIMSYTIISYHKIIIT